MHTSKRHAFGDFEMNVIILALALLAQDDKAIAQGKKEFAARCASCHFIPDTSLRTDRAWLAMIKTTH